MLTSIFMGATQVYLIMTISVASRGVAADTANYFSGNSSYEVDGKVVYMTEDEYSESVIDGTIRPTSRPETITD